MATGQEVEGRQNVNRRENKRHWIWSGDMGMFSQARGQACRLASGVTRGQLHISLSLNLFRCRRREARRSRNRSR